MQIGKCPFCPCGGEPLLVKYQSGKEYVQCKKCGAEARLDVWNSHIESHQPVGCSEKLWQAMDIIADLLCDDSAEAVAYLINKKFDTGMNAEQRAELFLQQNKYDEGRP